MGIIFPLFGIFTSFLLIYYLSSLNRSNAFLALFFLCCNLVVLVYYGLHYTQNLFWEGICFVHFLPLSYLLGPFLFFYVKTLVTDQRKLEKFDFIHLIPAAFIAINCLPFTTLPFEQKAKIAHEIINITERYTLDFQFVSFEFILVSRSLHLLAYCLFSLIYFTVHSQRTKTKFGQLSTNHGILKRWIYLLCAIQFVISSNSVLHMLTVVGIYFDFQSDAYTQIFTSKQHYFAVAGGGFFLQNLFLFLFPKILYGNISFIPDKVRGNLIRDLKYSLPKKRNFVETNLEFKEEIAIYLLSLPFTKKEFSIAQMSFDLKIPERTLSLYFNTSLGLSFSEWRKKIRIDYAIVMIDSGDSKKITIEAISSNAGFASRSKFIDAFKEQMGITPSAYIKSLEK
ncbi:MULTISPECIES: helix-turn-helix domain-containing protein [Aquirufa]|uniref:AraC family transcriptional regulator n=1 Tax=Aquirufa esocilacus TaxID=3096513 RepID=A0ABW6DMK1_9BACT|nr:AraC family transcriptional regulator [Aquirufa antheringensis]TBH70134.1 AraC family transcriptional regulator [Aquirufa antheringensis]